MNTATHNMDLAEIAKFDELALDWWEPNGKSRPLHDINPVRLQWINSLAPLKGKKILDIGCGGGILSDSMARLGAQVLGIDLSETVLQVAQLHALEAQTPNIKYQQIAAEDLVQEQAGQYDIITCMEMLEHVPQPQSIIHAISQLVKPGGKIFLSTIDRNPKSFFLTIFAAEYIMKILKPGTHEYAKYIRPSELTQMADQAGLSLLAQKGLHYNPFSHQAKMVNNVDVNYMQAFEKIK